MGKDQTIVIRGKANWAKVTGAARPYTGNPKYDKGPYWSIDVTPNAESRALLKAVGISKKLREPGDTDFRKESFLTLRHLENRADGGKNTSPEIKDGRGQVWDGRLIGNGTDVDVKVKVKDYGSGVEKGAYLQAIRVLKLVPYEGQSFEALSEDDEFFAASDEDNGTDPDFVAEDLDDEAPFS